MISLSAALRACYLCLLCTLLTTSWLHAQCISETDTVGVFPQAYTVPEGGAVTININATPVTGAEYVLYQDGVHTDQVLLGDEVDSLSWTVDEPGVYQVIARQDGCEEAVPGQCAVTNQTNAISCTCGSPSLSPATLDLCENNTLAVQGGLVAGSYGLLLDGNLIQTKNADGCEILLWDNLTQAGTYTVQGPGSCPVTGQTVATEDCDPGGEDCQTGAEIDWPSTNPAPFNLCQRSVTLTASKNRASYRWYRVPPGGNPDQLGEPLSSASSVTVNASGIYYLITPDNCGQDYTASIPLTFRPPVSVTLSGLTNLTCNESYTTYTAEGFHVNSFEWDVSELDEGSTVAYDLEQDGDKTIATATVSWGDGFSGSATIRVTANGCEETSVTESLDIMARVDAGEDITVKRKGEPVRLTDGASPGGIWTMSPEVPGAISNNFFYPAHPGITARTYTLTYSVYGCEATDTRQVTVQTLTNNYNYVAQDVFRTYGINPATANSLSVSQRSRHFTYLDGQGRTMQEVQWQGSPNQRSARQSMEYDELGRPARQYLPYVAGSTGDYQANGAAAFYNNPPTGVTGDAKPYALTEYEESPLSRPLNAIGPGQAWHQANKRVTQRYPVDGGGTVYQLSIGTGRDAMPTRSGTYGAGELTVSEVTDEDGRRGRTYTNKSGETVLRQTQDDSGWLSTYYVYDDFGNLRYVLPPQATQQIGSNFSGTAYQNTLNTLAFQYVYDERRRAIYQRVPGTDEGTEMVYDERDRLVLSQNAQQAELNQWSFVKYDVLNRPVLTGVYASGSGRVALQTSIDANGFAERRNSSTVGYTLNGSFPAVSEADVRTVTYYDDYGFTSYTYGGNKVDEPIGQTTGSRTRVLGSNEWLVSVVYYDHRYRPVYTLTENHRGGTDRVTHTYDFVGNLMARTHEHRGSGNDLTLRETYRYDHADRLLEVQHQTNDGGAVTVARYEYNELGEVIEKNLHRRGSDAFAQSVDYRYNVRGWLKSINGSDLANPTNINPDTGQAADLFGLDLLYHQNTSGLDE